MNEQRDNIYKKLQKVRVELYKRNLKKTGRNKFAGFDYYELNDFLPQCNELMLNEGLTSIFNMTADKAVLTFINCDDADDTIEFYLPLPDKQLAIRGANSVQNIGGTSTYIRRYLYIIAFEIAENDEFDADVMKHSAKKDTESIRSSASPTAITAKEAGAIVLNFGEHKGKTLSEIYKNEKEYFQKLLMKCEDSRIKEACQIMHNAVRKIKEAK